MKAAGKRELAACSANAGREGLINAISAGAALEGGGGWQYQFMACVPRVRGGVETRDSHREENKVVTEAARLWRSQVSSLAVSIFWAAFA